MYCLLCVFGGPFVKLVTCPICMICFLPDTNIELENGKMKSGKLYNDMMGIMGQLGLAG